MTALRRRREEVQITKSIKYKCHRLEVVLTTEMLYL
jgi:hypothetical protein